MMSSILKTSELYNYTDDNTLSYSDSDINNLVKNLEMESLELIKWFSINQMKANPENFQAIAVGKKAKIKIKLLI
jgi:hypothetical protein